MPFVGVESWAVEPAYVDFLAADVRRAAGDAAGRRRASCSRPTRSPDASSTPATRTRTSCAPPPRPWPAGSGWTTSGWSTGWQSAGRTPEPWLGPDMLGVVDALAADPDVDGLLVCPCGFVADHLEVLYDLDIEAGAPGRRAGPGVRPHGVDERRPRRSSAPSPIAVVALVTRVLVVGGGITGLTVAYELAGLLPDASIELREADDRLGGKLRTSPFAGLPAVDEGADAFLARVPHATALAGAVGLGAELTSPTDATAAVWYDGLHPIPEGLLLGVPADILRLARSDLLTWRGKARAALEPLLPRTRPRRLDRCTRARPLRRRGPRAPRRRARRQHLRRRHRPLQPGDGAAAGRPRRARPQPAAQRPGRARRRAGRRRSGVPRAPRRHGVARRRRRRRRRRARGDADDRDARSTVIAADGAGWRVDDDRFDAVVLATPAAPTAPLLADAAPEAARLLATMDHAGVVLVTLAVPALARAAARAQRLPRPQAGPGTRHGGVVRLAEVGPLARRRRRGAAGVAGPRRPSGRRPRRRRRVDHAVREVGRHLGVDLQPTATRVSRWPRAFPQYRPHHRRLARRGGRRAAGRPPRHRRQLRRHRHPGVHRPGPAHGGPRRDPAGARLSQP